MKTKKRRLPFWMRRNVSCPDCGFVYNINSYSEAGTLISVKLPNSIDLTDQVVYITCPRCKWHGPSNELNPD
jgi:phage FluMu protein Com